MAGERGSGLVGSLTGVAVFLTLLFVAVHLLVHLYATSVVTAVAFDAVRVVSGAGRGGDRASVAASAEASARELLGRYASEARFEWQSLGPDVVILHVSADSPNLLPAAVSGPVGLDRIERTLRVRIEEFQ